MFLFHFHSLSFFYIYSYVTYSCYLLSFCLSIYKITTMKWFLINEEHDNICFAVNIIIIQIRNSELIYVLLLVFN